MNKEVEILYSRQAELFEMSPVQLMNLFFIDIALNGNHIPLLFDTGGTITLLSESIAERYHLSSLCDSVKAGGNSGIINTFSMALLPRFSIGNHTIVNAKAIIVPDKHLDFGLDEKGKPLKINGVLGWDLIRQFKWVIDPFNRSYQIEKPKFLENKKQLYWDNMPIISGEYLNQNMFFGFDSGNTESMFSREFIPYLESKIEKSDKIVGIDGVREEMVYLAKHILLRIAGQEIELKDISVLESNIFPTKDFTVMGLLGADIIQNHRCIIDFVNHNFQLVSSDCVI